MKPQLLVRSFFALVAGAAVIAGAQVSAQAVKPAQERNIEQIVESVKKAEKAGIDSAAPDFTLVDTTGKEHKLSDYVAAGKTVVLEWFNPQCPVVQRFYDDEGTGLANKIESTFANQEVVWLRINSGSDDSRTSGKEVNDEARKNWHIAGPVLLDADGKVGRAYGAKVTPEMYVISNEGVLRYHGYIKAEKPAADGQEKLVVSDAVKSVLAGETIETKETKAYGCGVKYARQARGG